MPGARMFNQTMTSASASTLAIRGGSASGGMRAAIVFAQSSISALPLTKPATSSPRERGPAGA